MNLKTDQYALKTLTVSDFEDAFCTEFSPAVKRKIANYEFCYREVSFEEHNEIIRTIVATLLSDDVEIAGEHRRDKWEKGWGENLGLLRSTSDIQSIMPRYFEKFKVLRWKQGFIKPESKNFEVNLLAVIEAWLFDQYARDAQFVYEFGCGTGHNLVRLREYNSAATLWGLDWVDSSQQLIREIAAKCNDSKIFGHKFDYFKPDYTFRVEKDSVVFTIASLEQVGDQFVPFIDYLLDQKPRLCIHIEPIAELLDCSNLLDYLSVEYFKKRNYLQGFLEHLRILEQSGKAKIIQSRRTHTGSMFIEGCSVVIWSPL